MVQISVNMDAYAHTESPHFYETLLNISVTILLKINLCLHRRHHYISHNSIDNTLREVNKHSNQLVFSLRIRS